MTVQNKAKAAFAKLLSDSIEKAMPGHADPHEIELSISTPDPEHGDVSSSISFRLAKVAKMAPNRIAESIVKYAGTDPLIKKVSAEGAYVNAWYDEAKYAKLVLGEVLKERERYGSTKMHGGKVIIESPSVNPTKPWHVGHLRNALLGDSISNIYSFSSYDVEREDYIDDLGLQVAETVWGYLNLPKKEHAKGKKFDQLLGELYVEVNKVIKEKKTTEAVTKLQKKMEKGEGRDARLAREISEKCVKSQYETAFSYGISKNVLVWESNIVQEKLLEKALHIAEKEHAVETPSSGKYEGCIVMDLEKVRGFAREFENPEERYKVLVRSNGIATYAAKDFAFHLWKFGLIDADFKFSEFIKKQPNGKALLTTSSEGKEENLGSAKYAINVVDMGQSHEQSTVRALLKLVGHEEMAQNLIHLAYGRVILKEGTLSGRKGGWLGEEWNYTADDLLEAMKEKTLGVVKESEKIENKSDMEDIALKIALSAIKFEFLRIDPEKQLTFEWEKALDLNANSGPYCMYMYARASRILERAEADISSIKLTEDDFKHMGRSQDLELLKLIGSSREIVARACQENRPNVIADYLIELSLQFGRFYEHMPVLKSGDAQMLRLAIVAASRQVIYNMLSLLGIQTVESM